MTAEEYYNEGCKKLSKKNQRYAPFYDNSKGDDFTAKKFFEKSADLGYPPAMRELGRCYIEGYGILIKNKLEKGHSLLCKAILLGDEEALSYYREYQYIYNFASFKGEDRDIVISIIASRIAEEEKKRKEKADKKRQIKSKSSKVNDDNVTDITSIGDKKASKTTINKSKKNTTLEVPSMKESTSTTVDGNNVNIQAKINDTSKIESLSNKELTKNSKGKTKDKEESIKNEEEFPIIVKEAKMTKKTSPDCRSINKSDVGKGEVEILNNHFEVDNGKAAKENSNFNSTSETESLKESKLFKSTDNNKTDQSLESKSIISYYQRECELGNSDAMVKLGNCYYLGNGVEKNSEKAVYFYQKGVELGNRYAMCNLGFCYLYGYGIRQFYSKADYWLKNVFDIINDKNIQYIWLYFKKGLGNSNQFTNSWHTKVCQRYIKNAELGDIDSMLWLAEYGNREDSFSWLQSAAKLDSIHAMIKLGSKYQSLENYHIAEYWYKKAAQLNDYSAMVSLRYLYMLWIGHDKEAKFWEKELSKKNKLATNCEQIKEREIEDIMPEIPMNLGIKENPVTKSLDKEIMFNLAVSYEDGKGVAHNVEKVKYWYLRSAESGNQNAMLAIARCYEDGYGTDVNLKEAVKWYKNVNNSLSSTCIKRIKSKKEWKKLIFDEKEKAAYEGDADAMCFVGNCYEKGQCVSKNQETAFLWYKRAAEQGSTVAMHKLGEYFHKGIVGAVNLKEAVLWYEKANDKKSQEIVVEIKSSNEWKKIIMEEKEATVDDHDDVTMNEIAHFYCNGDFQDYSKCYYWFRKSAELGNKNSQLCLAWCYLLGNGVKKDLQEAVKWLKKENSENAQKCITEIKDSTEWKQLTIDNLEKETLKGSVDDMWQLGINYLYARNDIPRDAFKAKEWFRKSAEMGNSAASIFMNLRNPIMDLANVVSPSYESTNCEIKAPIGHQSNGKTVEFNLDINKGHYHAFVIGETGSGKSRFLHDIIISMISKYSPEDVEFYLMDFKGVEFNPYRDIKHSRVVLVDRADERITYEVIYELKEKMQERQRLLAFSGASDVDEYNKSANNNHLSQIILVVDECQTLFTDKSKNSRLQNEMVDIIALIAQQGRAYGVHLLMATQSLTNAKQLGNEILNQISEHYILPCLPKDAARLVPDHEQRETEDIVAKMEKGKGQCYYQGVNGKFVFIFNYIAKGEPQTTYINLARNKSEKCNSNGQIYFSGSLQFSLNKDIIDRLSRIGRDNLVASPGQNIDLKQEPLSLILRNDMSENVMLLGINDKHYVTHTALNLLSSLITVSMLKDLPCKFYLFDCYDDEDAEYMKVLNALKDTGKCQIVSRRNRQRILYDLCKDIANNNTQTQQILLILGEENFRELKLNTQLPSDVISPISQTNYSSSSCEDTIAMMNALYNPVTSEDISHIKSTGDAMEYILCKGSDCGIFTIMQLDKIDHLYINNDGYVNIKNVYEKFKHFIIFRSNEKDIPVLRLPDDIRPEKLEDNPRRLRAYYYNDGNGKHSLFTPYTPLTQEQINILI